MTALTVDPFTVPDSPSAPDDLETPTGCRKNPWCVKDAGHSGQCKKHPADKARNQRKGSPHKPARPGGGLSAAPTRPGRTGKQSMLAPVLAMAYGGLGVKLESSSYDDEGNPGPLVAAGRVMQFQAPLAGVAIDKALTRIPAYQRVAKLTGNTLVDDLAPLLLGPVLAVAMASSELARTSLEPMFLAVMQAASLEVVKLQKDQERAYAAVIDHQSEADELAREMLDHLFAVPTPPPAEQ